jgi:hypothetical protein
MVHSAPQFSQTAPFSFLQSKAFWPAEKKAGKSWPDFPAAKTREQSQQSAD